MKDVDRRSDNLTILNKKWERKTLTEALKEKGEWKECFEDSTGKIIRRLYTPLDLDRVDFNYVSELGFPGEFPYTRGIDPLMYRGEPWIIGQYAGFGSAADTNRRWKYLLDQGEDIGIYVALDLPTQIGYDSDHPMAKGEVGRVGVAIDSLRDMEILFDGIPFEQVRQLNTTANAIGPIMLAMFIVLAEDKGVSTSQLRLALQNDILKEYVARGTYIFPPEPGVRFVADVIEYCTKNMPKASPICVCGSHMRGAGGNAVQEVAFALSNAFAYIEKVHERGLKIDEFVRGWELLFNAHNNFFEEIAKLRASRRLWAKFLKERYSVENPECQKIKIKVAPTGATLTMQQPLNNIARITMQKLAAVLGGSQWVFSMQFDEGHAIPTEESATLSIRTQQILANETGVVNTVDPLGGSYYVETLTNEIEKEIRNTVDKIDQMGGAIAAIEKGYFQREIAEGAYRQQMKIDSGETVVVGVNKFKTDKEPPTHIFRHDYESEKRQIDLIKEVKKDRNNEAVSRSLRRIKEVALGSENTLPVLIEAIKNYVTIGEVCDVFRSVFGDYKEEMIF